MTETHTYKPGTPLLESDGSFAVRELKGTDVFIAIFFYFIFFLALYNVIEHSRPGHSIFYFRLLLFTLLPAVAYTVKVFSKRICMLVNRQGIYNNNLLFTNWQNFVSAQYTLEDKPGSLRDYIVIHVYYRNEYDMTYHVRNIRLSMTANKSEQEIIRAIQYFYDLSQREGEE